MQTGRCFYSFAVCKVRDRKHEMLFLSIPKERVYSCGFIEYFFFFIKYFKWRSQRYNGNIFCHCVTFNFRTFINFHVDSLILILFPYWKTLNNKVFVIYIQTFYSFHLITFTKNSLRFLISARLYFFVSFAL